MFSYSSQRTPVCLRPSSGHEQALEPISLSLSLFFFCFFFCSVESQDTIWVSEKAELQEETPFGKQRWRRTHSDVLSYEPLPWLPIAVCLRLTQHGAKQENESTFHQKSDRGVFYSQTMNKHSINKGTSRTFCR